MVPRISGPNREPPFTSRAPLAVRHVPTFSRCDVPMTTVLPSGDAPLLPLDAPLARTPGAPSLQRQLLRRVRDAILGGAMPAGTRLPGTRALAETLGVSRNTTAAVYEQLVAEGFPAVRPPRYARGRLSRQRRRAGVPRRRRRAAARPDSPEPHRHRRIGGLPAGRARADAFPGGRMAPRDRPRAAPRRPRPARLWRPARRGRAARIDRAPPGRDARRALRSRADRDHGRRTGRDRAVRAVADEPGRYGVGRGPATAARAPRCRRPTSTSCRCRSTRKGCAPTRTTGASGRRASSIRRRRTSSRPAPCCRSRAGSR